MIKQYVGARYVPKFADPVAWASGTSYEAMTIVTYNNSSYTSKVPVPATVGNPADNADYWALTGNYNAQVEQYRQETESYKTQVDGYKQETEQYRQEVSENNNKITALSAQHRQDVDRVQKEINTNSDNITNLSNKVALNSLPIRDFINYYGAAHTGDMSELLQTALNECASNNIILFVPSGDYSIKSSITLPNNAKLVGAGMFNTRFICESDFLVGNTSTFECENYFLYGFSAKGLGIKTDEQKGIKLWGVSGNIEYVCMNSFGIGFDLLEPDDNYQSKVDEKEGHFINNCTAMYCNTGFRVYMYDSIFNNIVCARCNNGFLATGGGPTINNIHIWGFSNIGFQTTSGLINNLQLEGCLNPSPSACLYLGTGNIEINNFYFWNCRTNNFWWILQDNCNVIMRNVIVGNAGTLTTADPSILRGFWGNANSVMIEGIVDDSYTSGNLFDPGQSSVAKAVTLMVSKNAIDGCTQVSGHKQITLS